MKLKNSINPQVKPKIKVSLGIITLDEPKLLKNFLKSLKNQQTKNFKLSEIYIVTSKKHFSKLKHLKFIKSLKLKFLNEKIRKGKYHAVNLFLKKAKSEILLLSSGDLELSKNAIENICLPFKNKKVGIVASKPFSKKKAKTYLDSVQSILWEIHNNISEKKPKYGEFIAFRNLNFQIPETSVDEEAIAKIILSNNLKGVYSKRSMVYNRNLKKASDFIEQRRRIYCGHLKLRNDFLYEVPTLNSFVVFYYFVKTIVSLKLLNPFVLTYCIMLELYSRFLGTLDYFLKREKIIWKLSEKS